MTTREMLDTEIFSLINGFKYRIMTKADRAKTTRKIKTLKKKADMINYDFLVTARTKVAELKARSLMTTFEAEEILGYIDKTLKPK